MKKTIVASLLGLAPFLFVWICFLFTAFSFDPREIFTAPLFWTVSVFYWILYLSVIGPFLEEIVGDN